MALKLNGKDDRLRRADFKALAATAGIRAADADRSIDAVAQAVGRAATELAPPPSGAERPAAEVAAAMRGLVKERVESLG